MFQIGYCFYRELNIHKPSMSRDIYQELADEEKLERKFVKLCALSVRYRSFNSPITIEEAKEEIRKLVKAFKEGYSRGDL